MRRLAAFVAAAITLAGGSVLAQRTIGVQPAPATGGAGSYGDSWAVVIGINDYQHPRVPKLRYAVNDARAIEQALVTQGFGRDRIVTLIDGQATKSRIERLLGDELRQRVGPNDRLLVFFAGHGKTDRLRSGEEEGYLIPVDGDPGSLFGTAISMTALRQISDRLPAKHILYVVDACYSGYALYNRAISDELLEEMVKKPAIQILTAGRPGGVSPYGAHDMAGNVWEWVADWYDTSYYQRSPERNPRGPESGQSRVLRGGSWHDFPIFLRSAYRSSFTHRHGVIGVRCARGLP